MRHDWEWKLQAGRPTRYDRHEVVVFEWEKYNGGAEPPGNARDFIAWLNGLIEGVPAEFRDSVYIELDSTGGYEGSHYVTVKVAYRRPETDEEIGARQAEYDAALRAKEEFERAELDRLKQKFGK